MDPLNLDFESIYASCADLLNGATWPTNTIDGIYNELLALDGNTPSVIQSFNENGATSNSFSETSVTFKTEINSEPSTSAQITDEFLSPIPGPSNEGRDYLNGNPGNSQAGDSVSYETGFGSMEGQVVLVKKEEGDEYLFYPATSIEDFVEHIDYDYVLSEEKIESSPEAGTPSSTPTTIHSTDSMNSNMTDTSMGFQSESSDDEPATSTTLKIPKPWRGAVPRARVIKIAHKYLLEKENSRKEQRYFFKDTGGVSIKHFRNYNYEKLLRQSAWKEIINLHCMAGEYVVKNKIHYCTACYPLTEDCKGILKRTHQMVKKDQLWSYFCGDCLRPVIIPVAAYNCFNCVLGYMRRKYKNLRKELPHVSTIKEVFPSLLRPPGKSLTPQDIASHEKSILSSI